jgi:predicted secreted protein
VYRVEENDGWIWVDPHPLPPPPTYHPELEEAPAPPREDVPVPAAPAGESHEAVVPAAKEAAVENVEVVEGEEFELMLPTELLPACLWRLDCPDALLALVSQTFDAEEKRYRLRLVAARPGELTFRCVYARPWDRAPKDTRTFSLRIRARG